MLKVKRESHSQRCEICHQTDMFDIETESCLRCAQIVPASDQASTDDSTKNEQVRLSDRTPVDYQPGRLWQLSQAIKGGILGGLSSGLVFGGFALSTTASLSSRIDAITIIVVLFGAFVIGICTSIIGVIIAIITWLISSIFKPEKQMAVGSIIGGLITGSLGALILYQSTAMHTSDRDFWLDFTFCFLLPLIIGIISGGWAGLKLQRANPYHLHFEPRRTRS